MPQPITLQKVNRAADRYYSIIDGVKTEITEEEYNSPPAEGESRSVNIAFDTPTGELSDGQYCTQVNGFHWVKIPGYKVIKISPDFIGETNIITPQGITEIKESSEEE